MTDSRKIQLAAELDATGVRAGTEQVKTAVRDMAREVGAQGAAAARGVDGIGAGAQKGAEKVDRATKSIIGSIERTTAVVQAGERGTAKYFETLANQRGVSADALRPYLDNLRQAEAAQRVATGSLDRMGMSAKQTANALRGVPAQFTDIVTSLQGGQAPLTVLLQQGGQLRDMFGSVGGAAKALGGFVLGLVNPFTVAAGAAGALALAYNAGANEDQAFRRTIILTGQAAGISAGQLSDMAAAVSALGAGTQGRAAEVLNLVAGSVGAGAANIERFTAAALRMEKAGGPAAEETAKAFAELGRSPLQAAVKLNEGINFLTVSVYEQIKALTEQGRSVEAARVAQEAYTAAIEDRAPQLLQNLGLIERAWLGIKDATKGAVDSALDIGRQATSLERLRKAQADLAFNQSRGLGRVGIYGGPGENEGLRAQIAALEQGLKFEAQSAFFAGKAADERKASIQWLEEGEKFLGKQEKLERAILKARNEGIAAGRSEEEIAQRVALIREQASGPANLQGLKDTEARRLEIIRRSQVEIDTLRATGRLSEREAIEASTALSLRENAARQDSVRAELAIISKRRDSERESSALQGELSQLIQQRLTLEAKGRGEIERAAYRQAQAIQSVVEAQRAEIAAEQSDFFVKQSKAREAVSLGVYEYTRAISEESTVLDLEASLIGASNVQREARLEQYRIELELKRQIALIDQTFFEGGEADREIERDRARAAAGRALSNATRRVILDDWKKTSAQIEDSITDALLRGFESGKGFAENLRDTLVNIFKTTVLRPIIQGVVQTGTGFVVQAAGLGQAAGGGAGTLQTIGGLGSAYNTVSGFGTAGAFASNAAVYSGAAYGTGFGTQQSAMLAAQESGLVSSAGSSALSSVALYAAAVYLGYQKASQDFDQGFRAQQGQQALDDIFGSSVLKALNNTGLQPERGLNSFFSKIGFSDKLSSILSGSTAVAKTFGRAAPQVTAQGVQGVIGGGDFTGTAFADIFQKGGIFRSDKRTTQTSDLPEEISRFFDTAATAVLEQTAVFGRALGLPAEQLKNISADIRIALGSDEQANVQAITEAMQGYAEALAASFGEALGELSIYGETAAATLERVSGALLRTNEVLATLGQTALVASTAGAKAALDLEAIFGGPQGFAQAASSYLEAFFTDAERKALQRGQLGAQLAQFGIDSVPASREAYRALAESQDLTTESGRRTYAALLSLAGVFAQLTEEVAKTGNALQDEIDRLRGVSESQSEASLLASFTTTTAQARAGDQKAIDALPGISKSLEEAAAATAESALDLARLRAFLSQSLQQTLATIPGFAGGGSFAGGLRMVGESGPELEVTGPSRIYSASDTARMLGGNTQALEAQIAALTEQVARLNDAARATAMHTSKTARLIERAMPDGDALATRTAVD